MSFVKSLSKISLAINQESMMTVENQRKYNLPLKLALYVESDVYYELHGHQQLCVYVSIFTHIIECKSELLYF